MWQWHILYPKSMTQLVFVGVCDIVTADCRGQQLFPSSTAQLGQAVEKDTTQNREFSKKHHVSDEKSQEKDRDSSLYPPRMSCDLDSLRPRVSVSAKHKLLRSSARHLQSSEWHQWTVQWTLQANWAEWARECLVRIKFSLSFLLFDKDMLQRFRKV